MTTDNAELLLDLTRSAVKRWAGDYMSLTHLSVVLAQRWPEEFTAEFGDDGRDRIEHLLAQGGYAGTEQQVQTLLTSADSNEVVLKKLHSALQKQLGSDAADPTSLIRSRGFEPVTATHDSALRPELAQEAAASLLRHAAPVLTVIGEPGSGRTSFVSEITAALAQPGSPMPVWRKAPNTAGEVAADLKQAAASIQQPQVVVLDDFDLLSHITGPGIDGDVVQAAERTHLNPRARLVLIMTPGVDLALHQVSPALSRDERTLTLRQLPTTQLRAVVARAAQSFAAEAHVALEDDIVDTALGPAQKDEHAQHPGLAIARIDLAIRLAQLQHQRTATRAHLQPAMPKEQAEAPTKGLSAALSGRVRGQVEAVETVSSQLSLTRVGLDLRPQRPDGVFLFVGPTGVGKTELALAIGQELYGGADHLIRLDMSEYADDFGPSAASSVPSPVTWVPQSQRAGSPPRWRRPRIRSSC
jgi:ATP-dependent Clp protease ATP-binding subunit ClpC